MGRKLLSVLIFSVFMSSVFYAIEAYADATYDIADYFPIVNTDTRAYYEQSGIQTETVNGKRTITVPSGTYEAVRFVDSPSLDENYYTIDASWFTVYGLKDTWGDYMFNPPLKAIPRTMTIGASYTSTAVGVSPGMNMSNECVMTITGFENITLVGRTFRAMKITRTMTNTDLNDESVSTFVTEMWFVENFGMVRARDNGLETRVIRDGVTHFASGRKKAELLSAADQKGYVYYEYRDENFNSRGYGRVSREQRADGSYLLVKGYWGNTETPQLVEEYNSNGAFISVANYMSNGGLQSRYEYYPETGNLKAYYCEWNNGASYTRYTFEDADYYDYYVEGDPNHNHGQGRLLKYENKNNDGTVSFRECEYEGDTLQVKKLSQSLWEGGVPVPGGRVEETFYTEGFIKNPRVAVDSEGNKIVTTLVMSQENGLKAHVVKYSSSGDVLWKKEFAVNTTSAFNTVVAVDGADNVYVAAESWNVGNTDLVVHKYSASGVEAGVSYRLDLGNYETVSSIGVDTSNNVFVTGTTYPAGDYTLRDLYVVKIAPDLTSFWSETYDSGHQDAGGYLIVNADGSVTIHGDQYDGSDSDLDDYAVTFNSEGQRVSVERSALGIYYSGIWYGAWESGRDYKNTKIKDGLSTGMYCYAFGLNSGDVLIQYGTPSDFSFPSSYGNVLAYSFMDPLTGRSTGYSGVFDNGVKGEAIPLPNGTDGVKFTKLYDIPGDNSTYWFLWGENVYEGKDNVVIKRTAGGEWTAYTFIPNTHSVPELLDGWTLIGPVADPSSLILPELGDWGEWCSDNNIVPEFPPLSSRLEDEDDDGRIDARYDTNDMMDTVYTYLWDTPVDGQMEMTMSYDHNDDGADEKVFSAVYRNGQDPGLENIGKWPVVSVSHYYTTGGIRTKEIFLPGTTDPDLGEIDPRTTGITKYYLKETGEGLDGRLLKVEVALDSWEMRFNGAGDNINCGSDPSLDLNKGTVSVWVKFDEAAMNSWQPVFIKKSASGKTFEIWRSPANKLYFTGYDGTTYVYGVQSEAGLDTAERWYNIVVTFDGSALNAYIDGSMVFTQAFTGLGLDFDADVVLGCRDGSAANSLEGAQRDVRVYNRALSASEIIEVKNGSNGVPGIVSEWKLDEGSGGIAIDSAGDNEGIISGPVWSNAGSSDKSWYCEYEYLTPGDPDDKRISAKQKKYTLGDKLFEAEYYYDNQDNRLMIREVYEESDPGEFYGGHFKYYYSDENSAGGAGRLSKAELIKPEGVLVFSESGDKINIGNPEGLKLGAFSVDMKVNFDVSALGTWQPILTKRGTDGKALDIFKNDKDQLYIMATGPGGYVYTKVTSTAFLDANKWYDIALTTDGSILKVYIDGVMVFEGSFDSIGLDFDADMFLGYRAAGNMSLSGKIKDVSVFNRVISNTEAVSLLNDIDVTDGLVSHWQMNDGSGGKVIDSVGGNDGVVDGPDWSTTGFAKDSWFYEYEYASPADPADRTVSKRTMKNSNTEIVIEIEEYYTDADNRLETREVVKETAFGEFKDRHVKYYYLNEDDGSGKGRVERVDVLTYDYSLSFSEKGDAVNCGSAATLELQTLTVSGWVNFSEAGMAAWQPIFVKRASDSSRMFELFKTNDDKLYFSGTDGSGNYVGFKTAALPFTKDTWYNIGITYDGTTISIYLNGSLVRSNDMSLDAMNFAGDLLLGARNYPSETLNGKMKDVSVYNTALDHADMVNLYNGVALKDGLVSEWKLGEGSGFTAGDSAGTNDAVIIGADWNDEGISGDSYYYEYEYADPSDPTDPTILSRVKKNYYTGAILGAGGSFGGQYPARGQAAAEPDPNRDSTMKSILDELESKKKAEETNTELFTVNTLDNTLSDLVDTLKK
ncbi:MAG: hypothetical protein HQL30_08460 [Candidatus Omnitrophica bacterium]|nr:hypothetical protein [Candidatus Omnitrophota bacterium]